MNTHATNVRENKNQSAKDAIHQKQSGDEASFQLVDNRAEAISQRKLQTMATNSPQVNQLKTLQKIADGRQISNSRVVQKYSVDNPYSVSENKNILYEGKQKVYASPSTIDISNQQLSQAGPYGSLIKMMPNGETVKYQNQNYSAVSPKLNEAAHAKRMASDPKSFHKEMGEQGKSKLDLWADCRRAAEAVTGGSSGLAKDDKTVTTRTATGGHQQQGKHLGPGFDTNKLNNITTNNSTGRLSWQVYLTNIPLFIKEKNSSTIWDGTKFYKNFPELRTDDSNHSKYFSLLEKCKTDIHVAWGFYDSFTALATDEFHKFSGINEYANPDVGESYGIVTEYDMPGFVESGNDWAFHWGGVVMKDGSDNITLENYSVSQEKVKNTDWMFSIYGTKQQNQTFHHVHMKTRLHGNKASTLSVHTEGTGQNKAARAKDAMQFYKKQIEHFREMERKLGVDFREDILQAAVNYNIGAEKINEEPISEYQIFLNPDRKFTSEDKKTIHAPYIKYIPV